MQRRKMEFRSGPIPLGWLLRSGSGSSSEARRHRREAGLGAAITVVPGSGAGGGRRGVKKPGRVGRDPSGLRDARERERRELGDCSAKMRFFRP